MSGPDRLSGNGVALIRERALAASTQEALERVYQLERVVDVGDFVCDADDGERESVRLRQGGDGDLEMSVCLPRLTAEADLDGLCQIIEGVSHFVYIVERARSQRPATQLELELQGEVDKWLILAATLEPFDMGRSAILRSRLYERVTFVQEASSDTGERYRVANDEAHAFVRYLERRYVRQRRFAEMRSELRTFFHEGQQEKLRRSRAA